MLVKALRATLVLGALVGASLPAAGFAFVPDIRHPGNASPDIRHPGAPVPDIRHPGAAVSARV